GWASARQSGAKAGLEYEGGRAPGVGPEGGRTARLSPSCRPGGPASILVMPELHSANIAAKLLPQLGGGTVVGPLLLGLAHPVQIVDMGATVSDLVNLAALSAHDAIR